MDKYEYLTCEDLGYKPGVVEQAKFESYSLGKTFDKGLKVDDKEEWHLKRIKNIEDKNEKQSRNDFDKLNKNAFKKLNFMSKAGLDSREIFYEIKKLDKEIDYKKTNLCTRKWNDLSMTLIFLKD